ncbi:MAG: isoamylase early set domain-containing protein [Kineosporiaceae bacterium]
MIRRESKGKQVKVTFVLPDDDETPSVSVVGDFNEWTPGVHKLVRRANGTRSVAVQVPAGTRPRFRYLAEGGKWFDDPDADERAGHDGVLLL